MTATVFYICFKCASCLQGTVYDITDASNPVRVELSPKWEKCKLPTTDASATTSRRVRASRCL